MLMALKASNPRGSVAAEAHKRIAAIYHVDNMYKTASDEERQETYLRAFLDNPIIPLDNNDAERSIKKFCVAKHSWHIIASKRGARDSAILYSIAETSKANGLKPFEYFRYLLEGMLAHLDDKPSEYIDNLLPWSDKIPEYCRLNKFE